MLGAVCVKNNGKMKIGMTNESQLEMNRTLIAPKCSITVWHF